jgi:hypothetical protein
MRIMVIFWVEIRVKSSVKMRFIRYTKHPIIASTLIQAPVKYIYEKEVSMIKYLSHLLLYFAQPARIR